MTSSTTARKRKGKDSQPRKKKLPIANRCLEENYKPPTVFNNSTEYLLYDGEGQPCAAGICNLVEQTPRLSDDGISFNQFELTKVYDSEFSAPSYLEPELLADCVGMLCWWRSDFVTDLIVEVDVETKEAAPVAKKPQKQWNPKTKIWKEVRLLPDAHTFVCPHCDKWLVHSKQPSNVSNHLLSRKSFQENSDGQLDLKSIIVNKDQLQEVRRRLCMFPYLSGYPELMLKNVFFKWIFEPMNIAVPSIEFANKTIHKELEIAVKELMPNDAGFYSIAVDGWSKFINTKPYAAVFLYHIDFDSKLTRFLHSFQGLTEKLNDEQLMNIFKECNNLPFGRSCTREYVVVTTTW